MGRSLFTNRARTDSSTRHADESSFEFYDRVDSPFFAELRTELSRWFDRYPIGEQDDMRRRLYDDDQSDAALWELIVHELHRAAGYSVTVHPEIDGTTHRPDFLMARDEETFLVEARVVTAITDAQRRRDRRLATFIDAINRRGKPHAFYTQMEIVEEGVQQPPTAELVRELEGWLAEVDRTTPPELLESVLSHRHLPSREFRAADWTLRFIALPMKAELRGRLEGPIIGIGPTETKYSDPTSEVRKALGRKGRHYGSDLAHPLVLALAIEELGIEEGDIAAALFGRVVMRILDIEADPTPYVHERSDDGYWSGRRGAGARVSGLLTIAHPRPWMLPRLTPRLWLNPWATRPIERSPYWASTTVNPDTGAFCETPATVTTATLLGLSGDWPPGDPFPR